MSTETRREEERELLALVLGLCAVMVRRGLMDETVSVMLSKVLHMQRRPSNPDAELQQLATEVGEFLQDAIFHDDWVLAASVLSIGGKIQDLKFRLQ